MLKHVYKTIITRAEDHVLLCYECIYKLVFTKTTAMTTATNVINTIITIIVSVFKY